MLGETTKMIIGVILIILAIYLLEDWEEERNYLEFVINQIKGMQEDIKESEVRLDENRKAVLEWMN